MPGTNTLACSDFWSSLLFAGKARSLLQERQVLLFGRLWFNTKLLDLLKRLARDKTL